MIQPNWKIWVKLDHETPRFGVENKKYLSCHHLGWYISPPNWGNSPSKRPFNALQMWVILGWSSKLKPPPSVSFQGGIMHVSCALEVIDYSLWGGLKRVCCFRYTSPHTNLPHDAGWHLLAFENWPNHTVIFKNRWLRSSLHLGFLFGPFTYLLVSASHLFWL